GGFKGGEALTTGIAFAAPAHLRPVSDEARVDHLGVIGTAEGAMHQRLLLVNRQATANVGNLGFYRVNHGGVALAVEDVAHPAGQPAALFLAEATGGDRRGADTETGGDKRAARIVRHGVLVDGDVGIAKPRIRVLAGNVLLDQADQEQVVLGAAGHDVVATLDEYLGHRLGGLHHLLLVGLGVGVGRFLEAHCLGGNRVHQRAALAAREHGGIQFLFNLFVALGEDQATARTTQGLVGSGGHHVGKRHRVRVDTGGNQASDVRHVDHQVGT